MIVGRIVLVLTVAGEIEQEMRVDSLIMMKRLDLDLTQPVTCRQQAEHDEGHGKNPSRDLVLIISCHLDYPVTNYSEN